MTVRTDIFLYTEKLSYAHPRLQGGYTGHGKTPSRFLFFWTFLTKTKQEQTVPGHFQSKFLVGSLQLGAPYFDPNFPIILGYGHHIACLNQLNGTQICGNMLCKRPEVTFETIKIK